MVYKYKGREKDWRRDYRRNHTEELNYIRRRSQSKTKVEVLIYYSGGKPTCNICGEPDPFVLTIDHIKGGGQQHRKSLGVGSGAGFYRWLKQNNYPEGFQVLCYNCNLRKYHLEQIAQNMEKLLAN